MGVVRSFSLLPSIFHAVGVDNVLTSPYWWACFCFQFSAPVNTSAVSILAHVFKHRYFPFHGILSQNCSCWVKYLCFRDVRSPHQIVFPKGCHISPFQEHCVRVPFSTYTQQRSMLWLFSTVVSLIEIKQSFVLTLICNFSAFGTSFHLVISMCSVRWLFSFSTEVLIFFPRNLGDLDA